MTVKELIWILQTYDPDREVVRNTVMGYVEVLESEIYEDENELQIG